MDFIHEKILFVRVFTLNSSLILRALLCEEIRERKIVVDMNLIKFNIEFDAAVNGETLLIH